MVTLLLAPIFGMLAYFVAFGSFNTAAARVTLGKVMTLKLLFAVLPRAGASTLFAEQRSGLRDHRVASGDVHRGVAARVGSRFSGEHHRFHRCFDRAHSGNHPWTRNADQFGDFRRQGSDVATNDVRIVRVIRGYGFIDLHLP
jgi:hypothetical protein